MKATRVEGRRRSALLFEFLLPAVLIQKALGTLKSCLKRWRTTSTLSRVCAQAPLTGASSARAQQCWHAFFRPVLNAVHVDLEISMELDDHDNDIDGNTGKCRRLLERGMLRDLLEPMKMVDTLCPVREIPRRCW